MVLREAAVEDVRILADAWYAMLGEAGLLASLVQTDWCDLLAADFTRGIERRRQRWLVAEEEGLVAATGCLFLRRDKVALALTGFSATIAGVYTWPTFRRRGYARTIVEHLIDIARGEGCTAVRLRASVQGRTLYDQLGFRPGDEMILPL